MKLHFKSSKHKQAKKLFSELIDRYEQNAIEDSDVIISIAFAHAVNSAILFVIFGSFNV